MQGFELMTFSYASPHLPTTVAFFGSKKVLAERPVPVIDRHADGRVGVHHLFSADEFELDGIHVELILLRNTGNMRVVLLDQLERPVGRARQRPSIGYVHTDFPLPLGGRSGVSPCFCVVDCSGLRGAYLVRPGLGMPRLTLRHAFLALRLVAARFVVQMLCRHDDATCFSNNSRNTG